MCQSRSCIIQHRLESADQVHQKTGQDAVAEIQTCQYTRQTTSAAPGTCQSVLNVESAEADAAQQSTSKLYVERGYASAHHNQRRCPDRARTSLAQQDLGLQECCCRGARGLLTICWRRVDAHNGTSVLSQWRLTKRVDESDQSDASNDIIDITTILATTTTRPILILIQDSASVIILNSNTEQ